MSLGPTGTSSLSQVSILLFSPSILVAAKGTEKTEKFSETVQAKAKAWLGKHSKEKSWSGHYKPLSIKYFEKAFFISK